MDALIENRCGKCKYIKLSSETQFGHPCAKIEERIKLFHKVNTDMDPLDKYRFSPSVFVRAKDNGCTFFKSNDDELDLL